MTVMKKLQIWILYCVVQSSKFFILNGADFTAHPWFQKAVEFFVFIDARVSIESVKSQEKEWTAMSYSFVVLLQRHNYGVITYFVNNPDLFEMRG